jgi:multidrug efflux system membrane fusion protein
MQVQQIEISLGLPESLINMVKKDMQVRVDFTAIPNEDFEAVVQKLPQL